MAYEDNQTDFPVPSGDGQDKRRSEYHLPKYFRTEKNSKFLSSTLDQLLQPGVAEKVNGYYGRNTAPGFRESDNYVGDISKQRSDYQFEPASVIRDNLGNVEYYKDYTDYINQVRNFGGVTNFDSKLNSEEFYAWDPHIDWDKFTNFREYYWLPMGPQVVSVRGEAREITSTYTVSLLDAGGDFTYIFTPDGATNNPTLKLFRGVTYRFEIDTPGHPLTFRTARTLEDQFLLKTGVDAGAEIDVQEVEDGVITLTLNENTPNELYYVSSEDINLGGLIKVANIEEASAIDVESEIIGKKFYTTVDGLELTNGLRVNFIGDVTPAKYREKEWFVEGVGNKITLVSDEDIEVSFPVGIDFLVPFDTEEGFDKLPFGSSVGYPRDKDYITINRASTDGNFWSRYNRWFHRDVIIKSAEFNNQPPNLDQNARANRPIIEFDAGLKLYNFGTTSKEAIDLIDDYTTDAFSIIEGSTGYNIDGVNLTEGMRVIFLNDRDSLVRGKVFVVKFIPFSGSLAQITLVPAEDSEPETNETIIAVQGTNYAGTMWFYDGTEWKVAQEKSSVNQPPLFEMFDADGNSYADDITYPTNNFRGTKVFSYKEGFGTNDSVLGFPLTYRSIENVGDIVFDFNYSTEEYEYQVNNEPIKYYAKQGFLRKYKNNNFETVGAWVKTAKPSKQFVITRYSQDNTRLKYDINCYDKSATLQDLEVRVYVDDLLLNEGADYEIISTVENNASVRFIKTPPVDSNIVIKTNSSAQKNSNGYYEIAPNLEKNPLNENVSVFTLGEVIDHTRSIIANLDTFTGKFPGTNNLRDIANLSKYGSKFIKHSSPLNLAMYHLLDRDANAVKAIRTAKREYSKFKRQFLQTAETLGYTGPVKQHVDKILEEINKDKTSRMPYFFSDMVPYGASLLTSVQVEDVDVDFFALSFDFDINALSRQAVNVYLNGTQLVYGVDYAFNENNFLQLSVNKNFGDTIEIYQYENTNGSFVPPTPTKLGLFPKFNPRKFIDNTYLEPQEVIEGHDGSITIAFGDFRDDLILELEKRIFNNIKVTYDKDYFNIFDYKSNAFRDTGFSRQEVNRPMITDFVEWLSLVDEDYTNNTYFERENPFTFNYGAMTLPGGNRMPGWWRGVFEELYDTDRPHTNPWEMLGFSIKPDWWEQQYGPAPYTNENKILWDDLEKGIIRSATKAYTINKKYARPGLSKFIPVDNDGNLLSPSDTNAAEKFDTFGIADSFEFGDRSPVETAWRRSSEYPFALLTSWTINQPSKVFATAFDRSRQVRNILGQLVYSETNDHIKLSDLIFPNTDEDETQINTAGIVNYIAGYMASNVNASFKNYNTMLKSIKNCLSLKVGGFTDKAKFRLILDSRTPLNKGNVFVPEENYQIFLNKSTPIDVVSYSGVIVEKTRSGFAIKGYDRENPTFKYYRALRKNSDPVINIGGITESFVEWETGATYVEGTNIRYNESYYRVIKTHTTNTTFVATNYSRISALPVIGGREAVFSKLFDTDILELPYGTILPSVQDVVDFLLGYGKYLESTGFVFEYFDADNKVVTDWETSGKEFLFWTTQNWGEGTVLTLSPAANEVKFVTEYTVVDNVFDNFYGYSLLKADGTKLVQEFTRIARQDPNEFVLRPVNTADGIYAIKIATVQKEHVVLIDNFSVFGDVIYDQPAGYRQERIKVLGYRSSDWDGSINVPGFFYDAAKVTEWQPWKDYSIGELVKYKEFYYTAKNKIAGTENFVAKEWKRLNEKPESGLLTNFEYKVNQFADFYDLDSDNFDVEQQEVAQHLVGYQKRTYLENIINDEVSQYKFYQGYIADKGTLNSLTKLFDVLGSARKESLEFYEEWAIKQGQYGASDSFEEIEFELDESKFRLAPQPIELVERRDRTKTDLVYRILPYEVYKKPADYASNPFPVKSGSQNFTKDAGYVNQADVQFILPTYDDILNVDFNEFDKGKYAWVGTRDNTWDIVVNRETQYRITSVKGNREEVALNAPGKNQFALNLDSAPTDINVGDVIGVYDLISTATIDPEDSTYPILQQTSLELGGWFVVLEVNLNVLIIRTDQAINDISECSGIITRLESVRVPDLFKANETIEGGYFEKNSLIWVDNDSNDWTVLKNKKPYDLLQKISGVETGNNNEFGDALAVDSRNTALIITAPGADLDNGNAFLYTRGSNSRNFQFTQILEPNKNVATAQVDEFVFAESQRFGDSVAMSPDGRFAIVGSPNASQIKTKFKGDYDPSANYQNGDSVKYNEILYEAVEDIVGGSPEGQFSSFGSIIGVYEDNNIRNREYVLNSIVTGHYPFENTTTDHILIRAVRDQYEGTGPGDKIFADWYLQTIANQTLDPQRDRQPFDGAHPEIDEAFLENSAGLLIQQKIDAVLYFDGFLAEPILDEQVEIGDLVFGYVAFKYVDENNNMTLYIKDTQGGWPSTGTLTTESGETIGNYVRVAPVENFDELDTTDELGGYWLINTPSYNTGTVTSDEGRAFAVYNVQAAGKAFVENQGANVADTAALLEDGNSKNNEYSLIRTLTNQGTPGRGGELDVITSDLYMVRTPTRVSDIVNVGDTVTLKVLRMPNLSTGQGASILGTGLEYSETNRAQTVYDIWDGYIEVTLDDTDDRGRYIEPRIGQFIQDERTGARAQVAFFTRDAREVTLYVKNVTGTWYEQEVNEGVRLLTFDPNDPNPIYANDVAEFGTIRDVSLGNTDAGIGKLLVFQLDRTIDDLPINDTVTDAEYLIYKDGTITGRAIPPNIPSSFNRDWKEVYNVIANPEGDVYGLDRQGMITIFERGTSGYDSSGSYLVPEQRQDFYFGNDTKIAKKNDLYKAFVHAKGNGTTQNPGRIYFLNYGTDNNGQEFFWESAKDKDYRGIFDQTKRYANGEIVYLNGVFYRALTNTTINVAFNTLEWEEISDGTLDFTGYVPNTSPVVYQGNTEYKLDTTDLVEFGASFDISTNGEVLVASAKYNSETKVVVFREVNGNYIKWQEITDAAATPITQYYELDTNFGQSVSLSADGEFLAISAPTSSDDTNKEGAVFVYKSVEGDFELIQTLRSTKDIPNEQFGNSLQFDGNNLHVGSKNASSEQTTTFDVYQGSLADTVYINDPISGENVEATTFDNGFTTFKNKIESNGVVYAYQRINDIMVLGQAIDFDDKQARVFGRTMVASNNHLYSSVENYINNDGKRGLVLDYRRSDSQLFEVHRSPKDRVDLDKVKRVILYDNTENKILANLDYIDVTQGKIPGPAEQEIFYKTHYDPAIYNVSATSKTVVDKTNAWNERQVGQIWWDLSTAKFIDPHQDNTIYSSNNWNTLFPSASIDVYEWVESTLTPEEWDTASTRVDGLQRGYSGTSKYGNSSYVSKRKYDSIAGKFTQVYYFWVKNKKTVPDVEFRSIPASDVARLIENPASQNYRYASFIDPSTLTLTNCESLVKGKDTILSIQYWINDGQNSNIHNQYQLLTEGLDISKPSSDVERKWFDSLVGYDEFSREVPDPTLSPKVRYGVLNKPRQSWFINRQEALKQAIERVNRVMSVNQIADTKDISRLSESDDYPSASTRLYDTVVDTNLELDFIGVAKATSANITPVVEDGVIVRVIIDNPGRGYLVEPTYTINGSGEGAEFKFTLDRLGVIRDVEIIDGGTNYGQDTTIEIRKFTALVLNDSSINNKWALYERNDVTQTWNRIVSQAYDTTLYWEYKDWYDTGYNEFIEPDFIVEQSYSLQSLDDSYGDIVKVLNTGTGGWLLLEKIDEQDTTDYSVNYKTVGKENGTIQFKDTLYNLTKSQVGFDTQSFDTKFFDSQPIQEIRVILETIRDDILVNDLENEYNNLFFASLRYVFAEQGYVDWAFKTSFVRAKHNVGDLEQKVTFQNDNLPSFQEYIEEVKPYKTKIREYISEYDRLETSGSAVTDFDLPPQYDENSFSIQPKVFKVVDGKILGNELITTYPDKSWLDNLAYQLTAIEVSDPGEGYLSAPTVVIESETGTGATARASLGPNGTISNIFVTNPGSGYVTKPTVRLEGSTIDGGRAATISPIIGNGLVRNFHTTIKFDRVSGSFLITNLAVTQNFNATGTTTKFVLTWPMDMRTNTVEVTVDGELVLPGRYEIGNEPNTDKEFYREQGYVDFFSPPANGATVTISYKKDISLLDAADRINLFYNPTNGQLGNDLGQLMDGVDYGGVQVRSFEFTETSGWDSDTWYDNIWDVYDETFDEESFVVDANTATYQLSKALSNGVTYNLYIDGIRVDDPEYDGTSDTSQLANPNAFETSVLGDGITESFTFDNVQGFQDFLAANPPAAGSPGNILTIRRNTSDGSLQQAPDSFDTALQGGDLAYTTATGLNAEDITVDGDGFVTPTTSKGPEEVVPGQLIDTLDITVYERPGSGSSAIDSRNYIGDGSTKTFDLGILPVSEESLFIKIDGDIVQDVKTYDVDYNNKTVTFYQAPASGARINIIAMNASGDNILDLDEFAGDGVTQEFLTNVNYSDAVKGYVTVDGVVAAFDIKESDASYAVEGKAVIRFTESPANNTKIQYSLYESESQSFSQVVYDEFIADGSTMTFTLSQAPFAQEPVNYYTIVTVNDTVLNPGYNEVFTATDSLEYTLKKWQVPVASISGREIEVFVNGRKVEYLTDFTFEGAASFNPEIAPDEQPGSTVIFNRGVIAAGDEIKVFVLSDGEYRFGYFSSDETSTGVFVSTPFELNLDEPYNDGDLIRVYQFSNHDAQGIERINYDVIERTEITVGTDNYYEYGQMRNGLVALRSEAVDVSYVWVFLNGKWLAPTQDYILLENKKYIKFIKMLSDNDVIDIIHFANQRVSNKFAWRQFKDMLNRTVYKRLDREKAYKLAEPLRYYDKTIVLNAADNLPTPSDDGKTPGIIWVNKERIEFFKRDGNILKQLRRGTLGTGIQPVYDIGTTIFDQSVDSTAPYQDREEVVTVKSEAYYDASQVYPNSPGVTFESITYDFNNNTVFPLGTQVATVTGTGFRSGVKAFVGQTECPATFISSTQFTFITPALPVGAYDLVIYNPPVTDPLPLAETSLVVPKAMPYVQILLPFAPIPNPASSEQWNETTKTGWYKRPFDEGGIPEEYWEAQDIEVFVGGKRLRKTPLVIHDPDVAPDSPEGDVYKEAEYAVNKNVGAYVRLTTPPPPSTAIQVIRKVGETWSQAGERLVDSEKEVAIFLRSKTIDLPR